MWRPLSLPSGPGRWPVFAALLLGACGPAASRPGEPAADTVDPRPDDTAPGGIDSSDTGGEDSSAHDTAPPDTADGTPLDADGDGVSPPADCDDTDRDRNPDAKESCDDADVDDDCDGLVDDADPSLDEASLLTWYQDADADGYGSPNRHAPGCAGPEGCVDNRLDCDDGDATISPAVEERCDDAGVDEDCDGAGDDADSTLDPAYAATLYRDMDGDGWGVETNTTQRCDEGAGWVAEAGDCADHDYAAHPGASEQCGNAVDEDCDGSTACPP